MLLVPGHHNPPAEGCPATASGHTAHGCSRRVDASASMQCTTLLQGYERVIKPTLLGIANVLGAVNRTPSVEKGENASMTQATT